MLDMGLISPLMFLTYFLIRQKALSDMFSANEFHGLYWGWDHAACAVGLSVAVGLCADHTRYRYQSIDLVLLAGLPSSLIAVCKVLHESEKLMKPCK